MGFVDAGLEFGKNKGKASLALNVTKFFRASRPVYRASSCYFEVSNNVGASMRKQKYTEQQQYFKNSHMFHVS